MPEPLPCAAGVLRCAISGEGPHAHGARGARPAEILAEDVFAKGGNVSWRDRRGAGRHRTVAVRQDPGTALPADRAVCQQSALSSGGACALFLEQRVHHVAHGGEQSRHHAYNVPCTLPHFQRTLEPNNCGTRLQCSQNFYGNELQIV